MNYKTCKMCNIEKGVSHFNSKYKGKYGVGSKCKSCVSILGAKYREGIKPFEVKEKQCSNCLEVKESGLFSKRKDAKDGRAGVCNKCVSIRAAKKEGRDYVDKIELKKQGLKKCKVCLENKAETNFLERASTCKDCVKNSEKASVAQKFCSKCKKTLDSNDFSKSSYSKDNLAHNCKNCMKEYTKELNYNRLSEGEKECNICGKLTKYDDFHSSKNNKDGLANSCKNCSIEKVYLWNKNNKERVRQYNKERLEKNPIHRRSQSVRRMIHDAFCRACKGKFKKNKSSEDILGCTMLEFLDYLESLFEEGMTWNNKGACRRGNCHEFWHIDHKIPLATAETEEDIIALNHYTNLQPMWASDNYSKGKKLDYKK